ncbi:MAG: tripartite tricarboxylate transporter TctB family protein [Betaproteobacteria bacterium]|nr:tripartite tricarboxylate transporter TctB family protein [Betaproteobacteria bacterium]
MSEGRDGARAACTRKTAEIAVALLLMALGAIVIYDSLRLGAKWGSDGPQPGYFPFYVGLIICISSALNLFNALRIRPEKDKAFVEVGQLKLVLVVLVPTVIYVGLVGWLGIYVSSAIFVTLFMRRLGKYAWWKSLAVGVGNSVAFFLIFEVWFQVPLPKGPLEALLGLD